jgi:hypothetical protein
MSTSNPGALAGQETSPTPRIRPASRGSQCQQDLADLQTELNALDTLLDRYSDLQISSTTLLVHRSELSSTSATGFFGKGLSPSSVDVRAVLMAIRKNVQEAFDEVHEVRCSQSYTSKNLMEICSRLTRHTWAGLTLPLPPFALSILRPPSSTHLLPGRIQEQTIPLVQRLHLRFRSKRTISAGPGGIAVIAISGGYVAGAMAKKTGDIFRYEVILPSGSCVYL